MNTKAVAVMSSNTMARLRFLTIAMVGTSLLITCIPLILPETTGSKVEGFLQLAIVGLMLSSFAIVAAILFVLGLKGFKDEFKKTYYYLCAGLAIQAMALLAYPTALYLGGLGNVVINFIGNLAYFTGTAMIFVGIRHFAKLLQVKTWLTNVLYVSGATVGLALILSLSPHTPIQGSELSFDLVQSANSGEGILALCCALLVWVIRSRASLFYAHSLQWLAIALALDSLGDGLYFVANQIMTNGSPDSNITSLSGLAFIASRIFYLFAGYSLIRLTHKEEALQTGGSPVDVIVYMAGLASRKADIDPMLDKLRAITVSLPENQKLSSDQLHSLEALYGQLREYLLKREPLLDLTQESLNRKLQHKFGTIPFSSDTH